MKLLSCHRRNARTHAKIVLGVPISHQYQNSEASAAKFKGLSEECYADSPERMKAALYEVTLAVKKPMSNTEHD